MYISRDVVLLITHSGDFFTVDRVAQSLLKFGAQPFRLDTDKFPIALQLKMHVGNSESNSRLIYGENSISNEQVQAVWMRRIWQPKLSKDLAPQFQAACTRESLATLEGFWDSLREARWVDNLQRINAAENKLRQLRLAQEVGLVIPRTLVTNNAEEVREFFSEVKGKMVAKLLTPLSQSMSGSSFFLYTSAVKEEDLLELESLRHSPMVFQEQIPKLRELRVVFVDGKLFVGALDASVYSTSTVDWRNYNTDTCMWQPHDLPSEIAFRLKIFMATFGLVFGAFDFIQTPAGEYVFLEVNPTGEWGMLERDLGYPISEAIAQALLCK
ncbi:MAG: MvdC family ATP-grasp ribosomal peptide maturase [Heteroscytonema crispum UTEX LB 1556]